MKRINPIRLDEEFYKMIKELKIERIKVGVDMKPQSDRRLSKAVARIINMERGVYDTLVRSPLEDDRNITGKLNWKKKKK